MNIQINIEKGKEGLFYATSPEIKGFLVAEKTLIECIEQIPEAFYKLELAKKNVR